MSLITLTLKYESEIRFSRVLIPVSLRNKKVAFKPAAPLVLDIREGWTDINLYESTHEWFKANNVKLLKNSTNGMFTTWLFPDNETKMSYLLTFADNFDDH